MEKGTVILIIFIVVFTIFVAFCGFDTASYDRECKALGGVPVYTQGQNCWKDGNFINAN